MKGRKGKRAGGPEQFYGVCYCGEEASEGLVERYQGTERGRHAGGIVVLQSNATQRTQGRGIMQLCRLCCEEKGGEEGGEREQAFVDSLFKVRLQGLISGIVTKENEDGVYSLICQWLESRDCYGHATGYFSSDTVPNAMKLGFRHE